MRGSLGSSSILLRSFFMNTVMLCVSPTNSAPQASSTSCSFESAVSGIRASASKILNSFGVSLIEIPSFVTWCFAVSITNLPSISVFGSGLSKLRRRRSYGSRFLDEQQESTQTPPIAPTRCATAWRACAPQAKEKASTPVWVTSANIERKIFDILDTIETAGDIGSKAVPESIRSEFGAGVRKLAVNPFNLVYTYDAERDIVFVEAPIHQRIA